LERTFGAVVREVLYQDGVLDVFNAREEKKSRVHFLCGIFVQNASVFSLVFLYLYICCICSVAMILELKILTKNMKAYMYARAKF
jgi:hypothetical protein